MARLLDGNATNMQQESGGNAKKMRAASVREYYPSFDERLG
jgi:hypothetical protein